MSFTSQFNKSSQTYKYQFHAQAALQSSIKFLIIYEIITRLDLFSSRQCLIKFLFDCLLETLVLGTITISTKFCIILPLISYLNFPLDETHLDVMRGLLNQKVSTRCATRRAQLSVAVTTGRLNGSSLLLCRLLSV